MKKTLVTAFAIVASGLSLAWAGHFTDILPPASASGCVPVSNGYDYNCSGDTSAPAPVYAAPVSLWSRTLTQINTLTPTTTGQILYCSNCANSQVCVSSGILAGAWVAVSSGTTSGVQHCN